MHITNPILAIVAAASLTRALPSSSTPPKSNPIKSQDIVATLAGTYTLVNTSSTLNDVPVPDAAYGAAPVGILTYSKSGYMSATITATEPQLQPNLTFPFQASDLDSDWALIGKHSIGYAGPFRVNEALPANKTSGQVFHGPLVVANVPTWVGTEQKRNYTVVREGRDTLLRIGSERGGGHKGVLWWKRID
ncbi:uncharacterized protein EKO05_0003683 [Ascochyta rabiei]|uniref:Lipocalin-like domain-containing protein n=1 Tax=Didymella rabiei TaxID=5454 RepID=A0A162YUP7_DIDRA|nr:uncharacterized protein EKO05_0003683 [Ascochyta rabiei]KZM20237.1 hypothetical protein ST47_g8585 [Ascochyta rabiei]UPX13157.1 hypothetical protein EKO05_0003683 [Ascochyta rabiei]